MAKFCTKCGKEIKEGTVCDCTKVEKEEQTVVVEKKASGFDFNEALNSYLEILKGIFTHPVDTISKFATSENYILGLIAILLNSIVSGVFVYCFCSEAMGLFSGIFGYGSLLSSSVVVEVPFMKTFLYGVVFVAVELLVTSFMIYVMAGVLFKDKNDVKKNISLVGVCSAFTTVTTLACIVLNYVSMKFMLIVFLLARIFYLTYLYQGISDTTKVDRNKLAYVFVPVVGVTAFVVGYILPKLLG